MHNTVQQYRLAQVVTVIEKRYTMSELVELLHKKDISIVGDPYRSSKHKILMGSLRNAKLDDLDGFLSTHSKKSIFINRPFYLHEDFEGTKVERFLLAGEYVEALRVAFVRINNKVKRISRLDLDGASLMRRVFSRNDSILAVTTSSRQEDRDEQEGIMHLFEGAMLAFRNPPSHNDEKRMTEEEAFHLIGLANYLMSLLDKFDNN